MAASNSQYIVGLKASEEGSGLLDVTAKTEAEVKETFKSVISGIIVANNTNRIREENSYLLHWLYRIRRASCARGLRIGFLQPDFLCVIYGPMMRSKKLWRTNDDIRVAVNIWCRSRAEAEEQYGHISDWDVSSVTDMSKLFKDKRAFNDDISRWDVSSVIEMSFMFCEAHSFNQAVGGWDLSEVIDMSYMFYHSFDFNQPVGDWDVSKVTKMSSMFYHAQSFDQDLTRWDMRSVTDTNGMLRGASTMSAGNKPLSASC